VAFLSYRATNLQKFTGTTYKRAQEAESDAIQKLQNEAFYLYLRYRCRDVSAFGKLKAMVERANAIPEALFEVYRFIGASYKFSNDFLKAAKAYENSIKNARTEEERADSTGFAADCLFAAGNQEQAYCRIMEEIRKSESSEALSALYKSLAMLYELAEDSEFRAITLEKALEYSPNDVSLRFNAAYSYGENDLDTLALLHYNTLLKFEPNDNKALNNIAVAYGELKILTQKTRFLKKAIKENETLAAANLAYQYIDAGFVEEAMQILNEAKQQENAHPNVGRALAAAAERQELDAEIEKKFIETAREQGRFLLAFAEAYFVDCASAASFEGAWHFFDEVEATAIRENDELKIGWERGGKKHRIVAHVKNQGARITKYTRNDDYFSNDLGDKGYAFLLQEEQQIQIMTLKGHKHSFLTLRRNQ
jgi:Flp pilus assembly protein TadD